MGKLDGKVAVVTGAGSGIGAATAAVMASHGASVACADLDLARAEATAKGIREGGSNAIAVELDVTKPESNDAAAKAVVDELGGLHVAHLNAGVAVDGLGARDHPRGVGPHDGGQLARGVPRAAVVRTLDRIVGRRLDRRHVVRGRPDGRSG